MIGMRRTLFVLPLELAAVVHAACTRAIADAQRRRYAKLIEARAASHRDGIAWLRRRRPARRWTRSRARGEALRQGALGGRPVARARS